MNELQFRTKTGVCTVADDRLLIERSGPRGALATALFGNSVGRALTIYGLIVVASAGYSAWFAFQGQWVTAILMLLVALYLLRGILRARGFSAAPEIPLASIDHIEAHPPTPALTRGYFLVHFQEQGRARKRLIILPGILENGDDEFQRAKQLLAKRGLLDAPADS